MAVVRELTKVHEEIRRGPLSQAVDWATGQSVRGEVVIVLGGMVGAEQTVGDEVLIGTLRQHWRRESARVAWSTTSPAPTGWPADGSIGWLSNCETVAPNAPELLTYTP